MAEPCPAALRRSRLGDTRITRSGTRRRIRCATSGTAPLTAASARRCWGSLRRCPARDVGCAGACETAPEPDAMEPDEMHPGPLLTTEFAGTALSVVIPVFNEAESIAMVIQEIPSDLVGEVIVADGGSTDGTQDIARVAGARVLHAGRGYGAGGPGGAPG